MWNLNRNMAYMLLILLYVVVTPTQPYLDHYYNAEHRQDCHLKQIDKFCKCFKLMDNPAEVTVRCQGLQSAKDFIKLKLTLQAWHNMVNSATSNVPAVTQLHLNNNTLRNISHSDLDKTGSFKTLNLSRNNIDEIERGTFFTIVNSIENLDLSFNNLMIIRDWFVNYTGLDSLNLSNNKIHEIFSEAFRHTLGLQSLNLSCNLLESIENEWFANLFNLTVLSLSHNLISVINTNALQDLKNITFLDLSHNCLLQLDPETFVPLTKLSFLSLENNNLTTLRRDLFLSNTDLRNAILQGNPWVCDSSLAWIYNLVHYGHLKIATKQSSIFCHNPEDMQNKTVQQWIEISNIEHSFLNCSTCQICQCKIDKLKSVAIVDCKNRSLSFFPDDLPYRTTVVFLENNRIATVAINQSYLSYWESVKYLNLSQNFIGSLKSMEGTMLVKNLVSLDISYNLLREIPIHQLDQFPPTLDQLYLASNPWVCGCNTVRFKIWLLRHHQQIKDLEKVRCAKESERNSDRAISYLMKTELCPQALETRNYLDFLNAFMAFLIVVIVTKLIYDCWWQKRSGKLPHFFRLNVQFAKK